MLEEALIAAALLVPPMEFLTPGAAALAPDVQAAYAALEPHLREEITKVVVTDVPFRELLPDELAAFREWYASRECKRSDCGTLADELEQGIRSGALALHNDGNCTVYVDSTPPFFEHVKHEFAHCIYPEIKDHVGILLDARKSYGANSPFHVQPDPGEFFARWYMRRGTNKEIDCPSCERALYEVRGK